ncbi:maleylpyruvate isomerase N-terminal domain-containing protein [Phaeacidiphilus oryzae]|uniref:maleylpyruvate isomerase N-terminal domain-containing protein n=1 Tax=Phaeacidiphilus oryzae TaxID=348818 RepID=UPI000564F19F|nr:maleylpyruvate isomerase N-terminal domain-containing protein [Phaeacidiphilus oryzae]
MGILGAFLRTAEQTVRRLSEPEVAREWTAPSALPGMTVGGLAAHLAYQIHSVRETVDAPVPPGDEPIDLDERYARADWLGAPREAEINTGILARAEELARPGPEAVAGQVRKVLDGLRAEFGTDADGTDSGGWEERVVHDSRAGWSLTLGTFLTTRLLELVVHLDDLAASLGREPAPPVDEEAYDLVLVLLARLAARRHGQSAVLRALARTERAPEGGVSAL